MAKGRITLDEMKISDNRVEKLGVRLTCELQVSDLESVIGPLMSVKYLLCFECVKCVVQPVVPLSGSRDGYC